ncbi:GatB/YqeY domain-containing protein [Oryzomonas japonica]|uniref:GatB/YqeY domain-containing protein n=2 Tax=Oryzomonas TaxID=2855184 RepID=A0A5A9X7J3_9BACT|nr:MULTISPECIES: GatB/YqeY domain-containing protein [Oryzomonas]KAA0889047.1 GatB/YqeY domain-containing protein [Oryzomonas rubra]KAB0664215.1 GatB/YqeY domain-containing protein [Oryzomonas japonica]
MTLKEQLDTAMKQAMKARDDLRLSAVRMVRSTIKNREIEQQRELDDQGVIEVISSMVKQRRESIRLYGEGNRPDLVAKEEAELAVLLGFLPAQLTGDEIAELVAKVIGETEAHGIKDMGRVMKALTPLTAGRADGKTVSDTVRRLLS